MTLTIMVFDDQGLVEQVEVPEGLTTEATTAAAQDHMKTTRPDDWATLSYLQKDMAPYWRTARRLPAP